MPELQTLDRWKLERPGRHVTIRSSGSAWIVSLTEDLLVGSVRTFASGSCVDASPTRAIRVAFARLWEDEERETARVREEALSA